MGEIYTGYEPSLVNQLALPVHWLSAQRFLLNSANTARLEQNQEVVLSRDVDVIALYHMFVVDFLCRLITFTRCFYFVSRLYIVFQATASRI